MADKTGTPINTAGDALAMAKTTLVDGTLASVSDVNSNFSDTGTKFDAHRHSLTGLVTDDALAVLRVEQPSSDRWVLVSGTVSADLADDGEGGYWKYGTITFATDADHGDPSFSAAPTVVVSYMMDVAPWATYELSVYAKQVATTGFQWIVYSPDAAFDGDVHWMAYGKTS